MLHTFNGRPLPGVFLEQDLPEFIQWAVTGDTLILRADKSITRTMTQITVAHGDTSTNHVSQSGSYNHDRESVLVTWPRARDEPYQYVLRGDELSAANAEYPGIFVYKRQ